MALLPPFFLHTVAAIGIGDAGSRQWIGTGFLFGHLVAPVPEGKPKQYRIWLITNKHVLAGLRQIVVKFNSAVDPTSKDYPVTLVSKNGKPRWVGHPDKDTDVAAIVMPASLLEKEGRLFSYFRSDEHVSTLRMMKDSALTEGDRVFVLGFPMGLVDAARQYVICRTGAIARIRDYLEDKAKDFLVDATVFPGNSGGPVVLCPSALAINGTKPISRADLIGVVKSYVPYSDVAVSGQTRKARIVFEENSGLTAVEPAETIFETVKLAEKRLKSRVAQAKHKAKKQTAQASLQGDPSGSNAQQGGAGSGGAPAQPTPVSSARGRGH